MTAAVKNFLLERLLGYLSPESISPEKIKINVADYERADQISKLVEPGDLIFTKTPNNIYEMLRTMAGMQYDHVAVALNNKEAIHISPPSISRIPLRCITLSKQSPLVVRLHLPPEQLTRFLEELHLFLGEKYSYDRVMSLASRFLHVGKQEVTELNIQELKERKICSNVVAYCLCRASPKLHELFKDRISYTEFNSMGDFLPDFIYDIIKVNPTTDVIHKEIHGRHGLDGSTMEKLFPVIFAKGKTKRQKALMLLTVLRKADFDKASLLKVLPVLLGIERFIHFFPAKYILRGIRTALTIKPSLFKSPEAKL